MIAEHAAQQTSCGCSSRSAEGSLIDGARQQGRFVGRGFCRTSQRQGVPADDGFAPRLLKLDIVG